MSTNKFTLQIHLKEPGFVYTTSRSFKNFEKNHTNKLVRVCSKKRNNQGLQNNFSYAHTFFFER